MTMFQFENLNEKLFNRVVCFAYSYPSGLGGQVPCLCIQKTEKNT